MKVSVSGRPDDPGPPSHGATPWPVGLIAAAYVAAHLPFLAPSLEDYDSINFALGLRDFNPALHQPHPPGSPVYIAPGRALLALDSIVRPSLGRPALEALTLALWSAVGGAIALLALARVFAAVAPGHAPRARSGRLLATALVAAAPLFWISGLRPMSDLPGLAAALVAQALILEGRTRRALLVAGACAAGLAAGIRVQTALLTLPLLALVLVEQRRAGWRWIASRPIAAAAIGVLIWAVPLIVVSGGIDAYLGALQVQAGEQFTWDFTVWSDPTPRRLAFALYDTFVLPWGSTALAAAVGLAAGAGVAVTLVHARRELLWLLVLFGPYLAAHLFLQEAITVRYALPALPLVAYAATRGVAATGRLAPAAAAALLAWALVVAVPVGVAYGRAPHPAFQAIDAAAAYAKTTPPSVVFAHQSLYRALQADGRMLPLVEPSRLYEWLGPVSYWRKGGTGAVWFFADPRRTDLDLIDPQARLDVVRYSWAVAARPEMSGTRPLGADWYRMPPPGWFAGEGWSLTPETGGLAQATATGPDHRSIEAWVRRREGPLHLVVGGRHLGNPGDPPAEFELALDGVVRDRWTLTFEERNFLRFVDIAGGTGGGEGPYAGLTIASRAGGGAGRGAPPVGIRQFDIQSTSRLLHGFAEGWHEEEYDVYTGRRWRWTSERAVVRVKGPPAGVRITLRGESPLRYFDAPPTVRITAAGRVIGQIRPDTDFEWSVAVPAADVARAGGSIAIETDRVYLPGAAEGTSDQRHLGLRLYECLVYPVPD
ncbi:MAG: hypothetical protein HY824_13000 [Acidobacteria bacterium]|nr:hypothetical protein [Acidobacteriota bacterium]